MLERLGCVSWVDPTRRIQVDLYGSKWTPDELGDVIESSSWDGSSPGLREVLAAKLGVELDGYTERSMRPDEDTSFVLWRKGERRPDRYLNSPVTIG